MCECDCIVSILRYNPASQYIPYLLVFLCQKVDIFLKLNNYVLIGLQLKYNLK